MAVDKAVRAFAVLRGKVREPPGERLVERKETWDVRRQTRQSAAHLALSLRAV